VNQKLWDKVSNKISELGFRKPIQPIAVAQIQQIMNTSMLDHYDRQSSYFRSLVSPEHPLMALYVSLATMKRDCKHLPPAILHCKSVLDGDVKHRCADCGSISQTAASAVKHLHHCREKIHFMQWSKFLLCFNQQDWFCQVCGQGFKEDLQLIGHMLDQHSQEQLWRWSLSLAFMSRLLS
jgi:hypothetical protein